MVMFVKKNLQRIIKNRALEISIIYALVGGGWILFSDMLLDRLLEYNAPLRILKGVLYAIVTALLLYVLIRRHESSVKQSTEALQLEEQKFHALFENANDAILLYELTENNMPSNFIEVNQAACRRFGYTRDELLSMSPLSITQENRLEMIPSIFDKVVRQGSFTWEGSNITKDGRLVQSEYSVRVLTLGGKKVVLSIVRDITARKRAEEILRESEAKYRLITENMSDLIGVVNVDGVALYASPSHKTVLGFPPEHYEGNFVFNFVHPEDIALVKQRFRTMLETKERTRVEFRYAHFHGHWVFVEAHGTPVIDEYGNVEKIVVVARDITKRKQTEEQLLKSEKLAVVGQLAAGVAHEIRNPMTALKGFLQLISRQGENARYCNIMLSELDRINTIVDEFLMVAKPQVQKFQHNDVRNLLRDVIILMNAQGTMSNVRVSINFEPSVPMVPCDGNQLKQVFINIIKNAIDAMPLGGDIEIQVTHEGNKVFIRFIDNGCGIPEERIPRLGEPFYTTKEKGTGLGLMVSYRIIEAHHGEIRISSEVNKGTMVEVVLPTRDEHVSSMSHHLVAHP
jgi:two-component system, sporulation sensor kinase A